MTFKGSAKDIPPIDEDKGDPPERSPAAGNNLSLGSLVTEIPTLFGGQGNNISKGSFNFERLFSPQLNIESDRSIEQIQRVLRAQARIDKAWYPSSQELEILKSLDTTKLPGFEQGTPKVPTMKGPLSSQELSGHLQRLFAKLDKDTSGGISDNELGEALQDPSHRGADAQALAALYSARHGLKKLVQNDQFGSELGKSTIAKLGQLDDTASIEPTLRRVAQLGILLFDQSKFPDLQRKQTLSKDDLIEAGQSGTLSSKERALLEFAVDNFDKLKEFASPGSKDNKGEFTIGEIKTLSNAAKHFQGATLTNLMGATARAAEIAESIGVQRLFKPSGNWLSDRIFGEQVSPEAVQMGTINSCAYLATMAGLSPEKIREMVKTNLTDENFRVTLPGLGGFVLDVQKPTIAEQAVMTQASEHGQWAAVLEKALWQALQKHPEKIEEALLKALEKEDEETRLAMMEAHNAIQSEITARSAPGDSLSKGVSLPYAHFLLTGKIPELLAVEKEGIASEQANSIRKALQENRAVTLATKPPELLRPLLESEELLRMHGYTVLDFDPEGPNGGTFTIRDTYGKQSRSKSGNGIIKLSAADFSKQVDYIAIERK